MKFLVWRASKELGIFSEEDFRARISQGSILPTDVYSTDGTGCRPVREYQLTRPPILPTVAITAPAPARKDKTTRFALNGAGALVIALLCPLIWKPLFLLSPGFVIAAFVMAIVAIVKGRPLTGAILIAACPVVMFGAFIWFTMPGDIVSETRKQVREREARP